MTGPAAGPAAPVGGAACERCGAPSCEHHAILCRALGLGPRRLCFACLAAGLGKTTADLIETAAAYVAHRDCYLADWRRIAPCALGGGGRAYPCLPPVPPGSLPALAGEAEDEAGPAAPVTAAGVPAGWRWSRAFDGGDAACGDLLFDLRLAFDRVPAGERVLVTARDAGAPLDLPAWCRLTGHVLRGAAHPWYLIETRTDRAED